MSIDTNRGAEALALLRKTADELLQLKLAADAAEEVFEARKGEYQQHADEFQKMLEACELDGFDHPQAKFSLVTRTSVSVPKGTEDREAFFSYLKERGIFQELITVNSQTLNAWYRAEEESALVAGEIDFSVPGLSEPNSYTKLQVRKR